MSPVGCGSPAPEPGDPVNPPAPRNVARRPRRVRARSSRTSSAPGAPGSARLPAGGGGSGPPRRATRTPSSYRPTTPAPATWHTPGAVGQGKPRKGGRGVRAADGQRLSSVNSTPPFTAACGHLVHERLPRRPAVADDRRGTRDDGPGHRHAGRGPGGALRGAVGGDRVRGRGRVVVDPGAKGHRVARPMDRPPPSPFGGRGRPCRALGRRRPVGRPRGTCRAPRSDATGRRPRRLPRTPDADRRPFAVRGCPGGARRSPRRRARPSPSLGPAPAGEAAAADDEEGHGVPRRA